MKDETVLCVSKFTAALSRDTISDKKARERERTIISTILGHYNDDNLSDIIKKLLNWLTTLPNAK